MLIHRCLLFLLLCGLGLPGALAQTAQSYAVVDATTGYILASREAQQKRQVGSLTKVATGMVVLDWAEKGGGNLGELAVIPPEAFAGISENRIGFQPGDRVQLRELLYAALVQSDNIAAYALAHHVGASLSRMMPAEGGQAAPVMAFVRQMNALARQLGMERTRFLNPTGFDAKEKPFSTALDMARLTRYAMKKASFRFYVSQKTREISWERGGAQDHRDPAQHERTSRARRNRRGQDRPDRARGRLPDPLVASRIRDSEAGSPNHRHAASSDRGPAGQHQPLR